MGQSWWWVVLAVVVVALLVAVALAAGRRRGAPAAPGAGTESASQDLLEAADDANGIGAAEPDPAPRIPAPREERPPAAAAAGAAAAEDPAAEDPAAEDPAAEGAAAEDTDGADGPAAPRPPHPASSALAALDSGLVGPASTYTAAAAAVTAATTRPGPYPGSVLPAADGTNPSPDHRVKAHEGARRYHTPDSPFYHRTRGDVWFRTAEEARAAGFTAWDAR